MSTPEQEQFKNIAKVINTKSIMTSEDIAEILKGIMSILAEYRTQTDGLNSDTHQAVNSAYENISQLHERHVGEIDEMTESAKGEMREEIALHLEKIMPLIEEIKQMKSAIPEKGDKGDKGDDSDPEEIAAIVMKTIKLDPEKSVLSGADIATKLETLTDEDRLSASAIEESSLVELINRLHKSEKILIIGAAGGSRFLSTLMDVVITNPQANDALVYDAVNTRWKNAPQSGSGGGMSIGGTVTSGTLGSVLFLGTAGVLAQDNANFYFQDNATTPTILSLNTNVALAVNTNTDLTGSDAINIYGQYDAFLPNSAITNTLVGFDTDGAFPGYTSSSARGTGKVPVILNTGDTVGGFSGWGYTGGTPAYHNLGGMMVSAVGATAANLGGQIDFYTKADGGSLALNMSLSNSGLLSLVGGLSVGGSSTFSTMTAGSVLFAGASGVLSQDNANLFYDSANHRLGLGTTTPTHTLTLANAMQEVFYNTADQTVNYERIRMNWAGNVFLIQGESGGTGIIRGLSLVGVSTSLNIGGDSGISSAVVVRRDSTSVAFISAIASSQLTSSSATQNAFTIATKVLQTSTAAFRGIWVTPWISSKGSGGALLMDLGTNTAINAGGTHTSKFSVDDSGNTIVAGTFAVTGHVTLEGITSTGATGTGKLVFDTTPTFTTNITTPLIIGGTGTTSTLILQSTSGIGATGANINFQVGNNGATVAMVILNSGKQINLFGGSKGIIGDPSNFNWFFGDAGNTTATGQFNTAVGRNALLVVAGGTANMGIGLGSFGATTSGSQNAGIGVNTGANNVSGSDNVAIGNNAGVGVSGNSYSKNIFIGSGSANAITTGSSNIFIGYFSGSRITTDSNIFIIGNIQQTTIANDKSFSLLYGQFSGTAGSLTGQQLTINGVLNVIGTTNQSFFAGGLTIGDTAKTTYKFTVVGANATTGIGDLGIMGSVQTDFTTNNTIGFQHGQADTAGTVQTVAGWDFIGVSHTIGAQSASIAWATRNAGSFGERMRLTFDGKFGVAATSPLSTIDSGGSFGSNIVAKTGAYTATSSDFTIACDATTAAFSVTLPAAASSTRRIYNIKKTDASANAVTIQANGAELIDGANTKVISTQNTNVQIQCDGTGWKIL